MPSAVKKPKALVICYPFEARICYFLAGLSHFYRLEVLFRPDKRYSRAGQVFFLWLFAKDVSFTKWQGDVSAILPNVKYDAVFIHSEFFGLFSTTKFAFTTRQEVLGYLTKLREVAGKLFLLELMEFYFFNFTSPEFWQIIDGVVRCYMFKKEYAYLLREEAKLEGKKYNGGIPSDGELYGLNADFMVEQHYDKIFPMPFPGSIIDAPKSVKPLAERPFDIAANFRLAQIFRTKAAKAVEALARGKNFKYSFDYGSQYASNRLTVENFFLRALVRSYVAERAVSKLLYRKYPYLHAAYVYNLQNSRCYLGLGHINRSLRSMDAWSHGAVLLDWNYDKMDCGIPMVDGYNYFSIGEREEIFPDNLNFGQGQKERVLQKIEKILSNPQKQEEIVQNQFKVYYEYFSSPANFVNKVFMQKAVPELSL